MKYPMINKQPRREVNVPQLSGGLNLRDSLTGVRDNQMTDCVNMWYKDGMLRTRPGFVTNEDMKIIKATKYDKSYIANIKTHPDIRKDKATLVSALRFDGYEWDYRWDARILFWWQYDDKIEDAGSINITLESFPWENEESLLEALKVYSYFVSAKDGVAYCYASNGEAFYINQLDYFNGATKWEEIKEEDIYIPTVMTHCQRTGWREFTATQFEGDNLLTDRFKIIYSVYNENDSDNTHPMYYGFGRKIAAKGIVKATIMYIDENNNLQTCIHEADVSALNNNEWAYENEKNTDGLKMYVCKDYIGFSEGTVPGEMPIMRLTDEADKKKFAVLQDNLIIEATTLQTEEKSKKMKSRFFRMTQSTWFGGAANGINDGSRLFLCGNTDENEKSLVLWSALNNPLYFNENNYVYVGDKSQSVTSFGQQGENLVIFKEKSTYYSYYATNDNITADDLINQSVVDYEANSVYFPMVQLNANIGCDCPNTVQLCRNRLVWANSDGNVYTLYSNNQYSERTIYKVSEMVTAALKKENDLKNAVSCDFEGHYLLCVGNRIYVMDYNSYGYQYASSFSKNEDSNAKIPWYIWTCDSGDNSRLYEINNRLMLATNYKIDDGATVVFSMLSPSEDNGYDIFAVYDEKKKEIVLLYKKIDSKLQTKLFDFSAAGNLKNINRVSVEFGNNGGAPINVSFVTDKYSCSESVELVSSGINERDAAFVCVKSFRPSARAVRIFGIKIECEGQLVINGLSLQYRMLGGVK